MDFTSAFTTRSDRDAAIQHLYQQLREGMDVSRADLLLFFCSAHFEDDAEELAAELLERMPEAVLCGCSAEGTLGVNREEMRGCSMAALAGILPDVDIQPFRVTQEELESTQEPADWADALGIEGETQPLLITFGDPYSLQIQRFLDMVNRAAPGVPMVGGMASSAEQPGQNRLLIEDEAFCDGLVGLTLSGNLHVRTVVSQGCRPIGSPFVVTESNQNVIQQLGGKPALVALQEVVKGLPPKDLTLAQQALFLGRVINEYQERFDRGDFLIHNIMGFDPKAGAIAVSALVRRGSTVQFHVRDAGSADEDLRMLLGGLHSPSRNGAPSGALLVSCNGRGTRMWPQQQAHDIVCVHEEFGSIPVAGCFAAGEIGPVGGRNFIHGFTASIAFLSPADA